MSPAKRTSLLVRIVCVVATLAWIGLARSDWIQPLELRARDVEQSLARVPDPSPDVVIVAFDEKAVHEYGPPLWSPDLTARLVDALDALQPKVIGLDFFYAGEGREDPHRLDPLRDAAQRSKKVLGGMFFDPVLMPGEEPSVPLWLRSQAIPSTEVHYLPGATPNKSFLPPVADVHTNTQDLSAAMHSYGHLNLFPGADQEIRATQLLFRGISRKGDDQFDDFYPSFDLLAVSIFLGDVPIRVDVGDGRIDRVILGDRVVPTAGAAGYLLLHFAFSASAPAKKYPTYSAADVMDGKLASDKVRGKIVLVGTTAAATGDYWGTPSGLMPGVEIHANAIGNMLQGNFFVQNGATSLSGYLILIGMGLVGVFLLPRAPHFGVQRTVVITAIVVVVLMVVHYELMARGHFILPLLAPLFLSLTLVGGALIIGYFSEEKQRQQVERSFRHYLDPGVIAQLMENPERLRLGGERRDLSVLFCDIRNFTTLAEGVSPEITVRMLNEFFNTMSEVVFSEHGLVDKFVGDQIMAFWGAPVSRVDHAVLACRAALRIRDEFQRLRQGWLDRAAQQSDRVVADGLAKGWLNCGVGVNTGPMVVGNIGSDRRFSYTVIGDTVNVASRLESLNKLYGSSVLIGPGTLAQVADAFWYREVDAVRVKGRSQIMPVYELLAERAAPIDQQWLAVFKDGLAAMRHRDWVAAEALFAAARERNPTDACAAFLQGRIAQFVVNPKLADEVLHL